MSFPAPTSRVPLSVAAALLIGASAFGAPTVKLAPSTIKISRSLNAPTILQDSLQISAARGEFEALQLVIDADAIMTNIEVSVDLTLSGRAVPLPQEHVRIYRLAYLGPFTHQSSSDVAAGEDWPDPLIPMKGPGPAIIQDATGWNRGAWSTDRAAGDWRGVAPNERAVFFLDLFAPLEQMPGQYTGTVKVAYQDANGMSQTPISKTLSLVVHDFALPLTSSLKSTFVLGVEEMCRAHGDVDTNNYCNDAGRWAWLYGRLLLEHRLTPSLPDSPRLSGGPGSVDIDGSYTHYWANYGPLIEGSDPDLALNDGRGHSARVTSINYPWWISEYDHENEVKLAANVDNPPRMQSWQNMVRWKLGVSNPDRLTLAYLDDDEPGTKAERWKNVGRVASVTHNVLPRLKHLVTTDITSYQANGGTTSDMIDVLTPMLLWLDDDGTQGFANDNRVGWYWPFWGNYGLNEFWSYQSCNSHGCGGDTVNRPNLMVDATAIQNRAEPWMHFIYRTEGILYFNVAQNLATAWQPGDGLWAFGGNGDGTLVYPGTPTDMGGTGKKTTEGNAHIPLASFRLKVLRDGLEDYEYLKQCERVDRTLARRIASDPSTGVFTRVSGTDEYPHGSMYRTNSVGQPGVLSPSEFVAKIEDARLKLADCIASGSSGTDPDWQDNPTIISAPRIVGPVMNCAPSTPSPSTTMGVALSGIIPGAEVEIFANSPPPGMPILSTIVSGKAIVLDVPSSGVTRIFAWQRVNGHESPASGPVSVTAVTGSGSLGRPTLHFYDFHTCAVAALTTENIPGADVSVFSSLQASIHDPPSPIDGPKRLPAPGFLDFYFRNQPLQKDQWISAEQSMCGLTSPFYAAKIVDYPEPTLPKPGLQDCDVYGENTQCVYATGLQPGALYTVTAWTTPSPLSISGEALFTGSGEVRFAVPSGTSFTASQQLCPGSGSGPSAHFVPRQLTCVAMPAPEVGLPKAGDTVIEVTRSARNADRFHVFAGADGLEKVGESTDTSIPLVRALVSGDLVRVFQSTANCRGGKFIPIRIPQPTDG